MLVELYRFFTIDESTGSTLPPKVPSTPEDSSMVSLMGYPKFVINPVLIQKI